jgi:hypothetical protein
VADWLRAFQLAGTVVGQWLGRAAARLEAIDWLTVVSVRPAGPPADASSLRWTAFDDLIPSSALIDYQRWAVERVMESGRLPGVSGPFGTMTWHDEVMEWVSRTIGHDREAIQCIPHRVTAYGTVLELRTVQDRLFFKGLSRDCAIEATITSALSEIVPAAFARTRALRTGPDGTTWWLTGALPGSTLAAHAGLDASVHVASAYARVQQRACDSFTACLGALLPCLDVAHLARWAREVLEAAGGVEDVPKLLPSIDEACDRVEGAGIAAGWVAADLDPSNVIVNGSDVCFIDLDGAILGPAPVAIAILSGRLVKRGRAGETRRLAMYRAYEDAWTPPLRPLGVEWRPIEIVATLVECAFSWSRVLARSQRGEVGGVAGLARSAIARRIAGSVASGR